MADQKYPEPTVGALIFNSKGELILIKSHKWFGKYVIPGGHIELGETMEQAVIREAKEETGLDVRDIEFLCFEEFIFHPSFHKKSHCIFFDFSCKTNSTDVKLNDEAEDYIWAKPEDALKLDVEPSTIRTIKTYLKKRNK